MSTDAWLFLATCALAGYGLTAAIFDVVYLVRSRRARR